MSRVISNKHALSAGLVRPARKIGFGMTVGLAGILAACSHQPPQSFHTAPTNYQQRHPIIVSEAPTYLDIPAGHEHTHLTAGTRSAITGFAQAYRASGAKALDILVPSGASNEAAASHIARHARELLVEGGVPSKRISIVPYQAAGGHLPGNVRLSFASIRAQVASECGVWPSDLGNDLHNRNYENFGCATQSNLAAIVADPNDLIAPRGQGEINPERAAVVLDGFEANDAPTVAPVPVSDAL